MRKKLLITVCGALLSLVSCKHAQEELPLWEMPEASKEELSMESSLTLQENMDFLGKSVNNFAVLTDSSFLVAGDRKLIIYSSAGKQIGKIGSVGNGPFQYSYPDAFYVSDKYVYVFSRFQRKLFVYDKMGVPVRDYDLPCQNVDEIAVCRDSLIACLYDGTEDDKTIEVFDLSSLKSLATIRQNKEEDMLLYLRIRAGGLCTTDDKIYGCRPSQLGVYAIDLNNPQDEVKEWAYADDDFKVTPIEGSAYEIINTDRKFAIDYVFSNSLVTQVDVWDNALYLLAETGKYALDADGTWQSGSRKLKIYQIDLASGHPLHTCQLEYPEHGTLAKLQEGNLYLFRATFTEDDMEISMDKIPLAKVTPERGETENS